MVRFNVLHSMISRLQRIKIDSKVRPKGHGPRHNDGCARMSYGI